jgi:hypothetical protein
VDLALVVGVGLALAAALADGVCAARSSLACAALRVGWPVKCATAKAVAASTTTTMAVTPSGPISADLGRLG